MTKFQAFASSALLFGFSLGATAGPVVGGDITIKNNKAGTVVVTGAKGSVGLGPLKGGELDMSAGANVNSVVIKGGEVNGKVTIMDNTTAAVVATGGLANVNSVYASKK